MADQIPVTTTSPDDYKELNPNVEYSQGISDWLTYRDVYESYPATMRDARYLIKHTLENKKDGHKYYAQRAARTWVPNFTQPIVDTWQDLFMRREPMVPDEVKKLFNGHEDNVDGEGNDLVSYMESRMLCDRFVFGNPTTLVDAPENNSLSMAEEKESGIRPFLIPINRVSLIDWSIERGMSKRTGRYNFMLYEYRAHVPRADFFSKDSMLWYRRGFWRVPSPDGTTAEIYSQVFSASSPNETKWKQEGAPQKLADFTEIPCYTMFADTWITDISSQVLKYLNLESMLDNILYYQGYRHTFVSGNIPPSERGKLTEYMMAILPENSQVTAIASENPAALIERLATTQNNIWRMGLSQVRQIPTDSKVGQSADSQRMEKESTINLVKRNIGQFENFTNQIVQGVADYHGQSDFAYKVEYNRDISEADIERTVLIFNSLKAEFSKLPALRRAVISQIVRALNLPDDIQDKVDDEIEKLPDEELTDQKIGETFKQVFEEKVSKNGDPDQSGTRNPVKGGNPTE